MPEPTSKPVTRRAVLLGGAAVIGAGALGVTSLAHATSAQGAGRARAAGPYFSLGVASGEPTPDGVVLWTRLAPNPTAEDGLGGMPDQTVPVEWEIASDEAFTQIVQRGTVDAVRASAHSVHVEAEGLNAGTEYFYRFRAGGEVSTGGRTRTAPAPGTMGNLTMCFTSCSHWESGFFTAYRRMADDQPDLMLHLGDYIYEYEKHHGNGPPSGRVRDHPEWENIELRHYRHRYALYRTDPDLQLAHATAPWLVVWDDHEVENNWADMVPEGSSQTPGEKFRARRRDAFRAYYENMPLRSSSRPVEIDMQLYRRYSWGSLAAIHMLDTRQYRSDQCSANDLACARSSTRSMTGGQQENWLLDGFNNSTARWDILGQQVFFAKRDTDPGSGQKLSMDAWDGYSNQRHRIASAMGNSQVRNGVVLTGDVHAHWASNVKENHNIPDSKHVGVELVTTSVSSLGNGDPDETKQEILDENAHIKYFKNLRGYVHTTFTGDQLTARFKTLAFVNRPGEAAPARVDRTFTVTDGENRLR